MTIATIQALAKALQAQGIPVLTVTDSTYMLDGEIKVTESVHVQVGEDCAYAMVTWTKGEGDAIEFWFSHNTHRPQNPASLDALVAEIKDRIKEQS